MVSCPGNPWTSGNLAGDPHGCCWGISRARFYLARCSMPTTLSDRGCRDEISIALQSEERAGMTTCGVSKTGMPILIVDDEVAVFFHDGSTCRATCPPWEHAFRSTRSALHRA